MYSFGPIAFLVGIAGAIVTTLIDVLTPLTGADTAAPLAIILLTVLVRALLIPVGWSQVKAEFARRRIAPKLAEVQRRFKGDPQRLQEATMRLYRREGTSPLAGCFPALLQAPVFIGVYGLFLSPEVNDEPNHLLEATLFGTPLGDRLPEVLSEPGAVLLFAGLTAILLIVGWLQRQIMLPPAAPTDNPTAATMQKVMGYLPFLVVLAVPIVPLAAVLYLATTTSWTVAERVVLRRVYANRRQPKPETPTEG